MQSEVPSDPRRAAAYMVAASFSFAAMAALVRVASTGSSVFTTVFVRSAVIAVLMLIVVRARGGGVRFVNHRLLFVRAVCGFLAMLCYFWALGNARLADAITLQYTSPLFVAAMAPFAVGEKVRGSTVGWLLFGFLGVGMVVQPEGEIGAGALAALASAALAAVAYLAVRWLRQTDHPDAIVLYFALFSMLCSSPASIGLVRDPPSPEELAALLGVGLFAAGGQVGMTRAYRYGEAAVVSGFSYATVALGVVIGAAVFGEPPSALSLVGASVVAAAGVALARS